MPQWRRLSIRIPPGAPLEKVLEKVSEAIRGEYAEVKVRGDKLYIEVVGTEAQIRESWFRVREKLAELWELYHLETRGEVAVDAIVKEAGRTFPPESLAWALKLRGYDAEYDREAQVIRTNAPSGEVISAARRIAEVMDELRFRVSGTAAKRLVAALSVGLEVEPEAVIDAGLRARVFEEDEDGRIRLREEWRRALRKLALILRGPSALEVLERGGGEAEGNQA